MWAFRFFLLLFLMSLSFDQQLYKQSLSAKRYFLKKYKVFSAEDAEDFQSFCIERFLKSGHLRFRFDYLAADYSRSISDHVRGGGGADLMSRDSRRHFSSSALGGDFETKLQDFLPSQQPNSWLQPSPDACERVIMEGAQDLTGYTALVGKRGSKIRTVVTLVYKYNLNLTEVADAMGMSRQRISSLHQQALQILQTQLRTSVLGQKLGNHHDEAAEISEQKKKRRKKAVSQSQGFRVLSF